MSGEEAAARATPEDETAAGSQVADLFGADVLAASSPLDAETDELLPAERPLVARALAPRQRAFATGRVCARALLARLGAPAGPLLADSTRAPLWPRGFVGSISHGAGLCVVAVARRGAVVGLGVDVESDAPLRERVRVRVCTERERLALLAAGRGAGRLAKLVFSAKEALYKCAHPLLREPLHWEDAEIEPDAATGRFRVRALAPILARLARLGALEGAFAFRDGRVLAGITLRAHRDA